MADSADGGGPDAGACSDDDRSSCLPDEDSSVEGDREPLPVATINGTIRLPNNKTTRVEHVLYDETEIWVGQNGFSPVQVDDCQAQLTVEECGRVYIRPGPRQQVGVREGPKQPWIVVKGSCQLLHQYEFTLGVTESPFQHDSETYAAQAKRVLRSLWVGHRQKQQKVDQEVKCQPRVPGQAATKSKFDFVVTLHDLDPGQPYKKRQPSKKRQKPAPAGSAAGVDEQPSASLLLGFTSPPPHKRRVEVPTPQIQTVLAGRDPPSDVINTTGTCDTWGSDTKLSFENVDIFKQWLQKEQVFGPKLIGLCAPLHAHDAFNMLANWMYAVSISFQYHPLTILHGMRILLDFLSCQAIEREKVQLAATTAMLIASKFNELWPTLVEDHKYVCDDAQTVTKASIISMEVCILNSLECRLHKPTAWDFMLWYYDHTSQLADPGAEAEPQRELPDKSEVLFLILLALMHLKMWQFKPSILAKACILVALDKPKAEPQLELKDSSKWTEQHCALTGDDEVDLRQCTEQLNCLLIHEKQVHVRERHNSCRIERRDQVIYDYLEQKQKVEKSSSPDAKDHWFRDNKPTVLAKFMPSVIE